MDDLNQRQQLWWIVVGVAGALGDREPGHRGKLGPRRPFSGEPPPDRAHHRRQWTVLLRLARINVGSMVPGVVATVAWWGEHVHAGQPLVQLGDAEAWAAVAMARAGLSKRRTAASSQAHRYTLARASRTSQADANLELAHLELRERLLVLVKQGSTPTVPASTQAKRALASCAEPARRRRRPRREVQRAARRRACQRWPGRANAAASLAQAEARAAESRITASVSAVVLTCSVESGDLVQPGRTLLVLARDGQDAAQCPARREKSGQSCGWASPRELPPMLFPGEHFVAQVSYIAPSIDPQRGTVEVRFPRRETACLSRARHDRFGEHRSRLAGRSARRA